MYQRHVAGLLLMSSGIVGLDDLWRLGGPLHTTLSSWPPAACTNDGPFALQFLCSLDHAYRGIWDLGIKVLGEAALLEFLRYIRPHEANLGRQRVLVWFDHRDPASKAIIVEQTGDPYGFRRLLRNLTEGDWMIDVGGHLGFTALNMLHSAPRAKILTIEPSPWNYFLLRLNLAMNHPKAEGFALRAAIGRSTGWTEGVHDFHKSYGPTDESSKEAFSSASSYDLPLVSLPGTLKLLDIKRIGVLKLDCEGCEWTVARDWLMRRLRYPSYPVVGEIHTLCPFALWLEYTEIEKCTPKDASLNVSRKSWELLCWDLSIDKVGCGDPHFGAFHSPSKSFEDVARHYMMEEERRERLQNPSMADHRNTLQVWSDDGTSTTNLD